MRITQNNIQDVYKAKRASVASMELRGYKLIEELFADSSGFGQNNEPALTQNQLESKIETILLQYPVITAKITDVGQFQVYVGLFSKIGKNKTKKIANNTYRVQYDDREAIRLHDTDILTFQADHVTLNSGGWLTHTTKERINRYLPEGVRVEQKNFDWTVVDDRDNTRKPFEDGMIIAS